jgi:hypothetical protein
MNSGRQLPVPLDDRRVGPSLWIPEGVLIETERLLRSYGGEEDHEGIVYWGGIESPRGSCAVTAVSPTASTTWGSFRTELQANVDLIDALAQLELTLVAQVHSHPGRWVDHSDGDDTGAIVRFAGFWSLVVPEFAKNGMRPLSGVGVHLFADGAFRRLKPDALAMRVRIIPGALDLRQESHR